MKLTNRTKTMAMSAIMAGTMGMVSFAGSWQASAEGWRYLNDYGSYTADTWMVAGGLDYHMNAMGIMDTGWLQDSSDGRVYYLDPVSGAMAEGWRLIDGSWYFFDTRIGGPRGAMLIGWQWIDGRCYYLDPSKGGACAVSATTPDGYTVDASGAWIDASGAQYYEPGKGISSAESLSIYTETDGESELWLEDDIYDGGYSWSDNGNSSYRVSYDSLWDDYSDTSVSASANDFKNGNYGMMTASQISEMKEVINDFKAEYINDDMSEFEKELAIIEWIVENCQYEKGENWSRATAYSCLVLGKAQCSGYADAFLQMAKACGLDARYVYNTRHAWNLVNIDGDWYHVDVTWEDPLGSNSYGIGNLRNMYINLTDSEIASEVTSHKTWSPNTIKADGTRYGHYTVADYLETGEVDISSENRAQEEFEKEMDDIRDENVNNIIHFKTVDQTVEELAAYVRYMLDDRRNVMEAAILFDEFKSLSLSQSVDIYDYCDEIGEQLSELINEEYGDVLETSFDPLIIRKDMYDNTYCWVYESVRYSEGNGAKIPYTINFIDKDTGEIVGTQTGSGERLTDIDFDFPEGYGWISNRSHEVLEGEAWNNGESFSIRGFDRVEMDVKVKAVSEKG